MNNNNTVINFSMEQGVSVGPQVHSYAELRQKMRANPIQDRPISLKSKPAEISDTVTHVEQEMVSPVKSDDLTDVAPSEQVVTRRYKDVYGTVKTLLGKKETEQKLYKEEHSADDKDMVDETEELPLILRDIPRDKAKNFTEYVLSRPVTFAHKCEDWMAGCSAIAVLCGTAAAVSLGCPEYIPANEKVAFGFVCAMGACMAGTVLSGIVGGINDCWQERKNRLMQEKMERSRD